jgi:phytol kinase
MSIGDAIKIVLLLGLTGGLLTLLRWFQVHGRPPPEPELVRKLFHIGGGLLGLSLPWLFDSLIPVLLTSGAIAALFIAMRKVPLLRDGVGQVLLGVKRNTVGEFCYIASICLLFWLTHGNTLLYSVPLLVLALADASAALIGEQYGMLPLHKRGDRKSYEGAAAFALTTFFCVHVPVLLSGQSGRVESLLIAAGVGVMVMMAEVAAWWGIDNIIIPLWTYMLLKSLLQMDATTMSTHLAFVLALALFMRFYRRHTTLGDDALFGATLWGYVVWIVGGWQWVLPPLIQLVTYARFTAKTPQEHLLAFGFPVVLANIVGGFLWLLIYRQTDEARMLLPFAACFGANLAIIALVRQKTATPELGARRAISGAVAMGLLVVVPTLFAFNGFALTLAVDLAFGLLALYVATALFYRVQPALSTFPVDGARWLRQAAIATATSVIALGFNYSTLSAARAPTLQDIFGLF